MHYTVYGLASIKLRGQKQGDGIFVVILSIVMFLPFQVFTNKCSAKNCHVKEVVPVVCGECKLNFCLKHRHPIDHQCEGPAGATRRMAV
jgi:hypothetical protein